MAKNIQQNNETQLEEGIKVETVEAEKLACSMVMDERDEYVKMSQ